MSDSAEIKKKMVEWARMAEQIERYEDMAEYMKEAAKQLGKNGPPFSSDERNLFSVAYKNAVGSRRSAWRILSTFEQRQESDEKKALIAEYKSKLEAELDKICTEVLELLSEKVIPSDEDSHGKVFYWKMKGDYYRYMAEVAPEGEKRTTAVDGAKDAYKEALDVATEKLGPSDPVRLGLALNSSVFQYEIMNNPEEACKLAKTAFDDAIAVLDSTSQETYKDTTLIMQLLRDNLTLWTADNNQDQEDDTQDS